MSTRLLDGAALYSGVNAKKPKNASKVEFTKNASLRSPDPYRVAYRQIGARRSYAVHLRNFSFYRVKNAETEKIVIIIGIALYAPRRSVKHAENKQKMLGSTFFSFTTFSQPPPRHNSQGAHECLARAESTLSVVFFFFYLYLYLYFIHGGVHPDANDAAAAPSTGSVFAHLTRFFAKIRNTRATRFDPRSRPNLFKTAIVVFRLTRARTTGSGNVRHRKHNGRT